MTQVKIVMDACMHAVWCLCVGARGIYICYIVVSIPIARCSFRTVIHRASLAERDFARDIIFVGVLLIERPPSP